MDSIYCTYRLEIQLMEESPLLQLIARPVQGPNVIKLFLAYLICRNLVRNLAPIAYGLNYLNVANLLKFKL